MPPLDICMGIPFVHDGLVYLLGSEFGRRNVIISRSEDEGLTWGPFVTLFDSLKPMATLCVQSGKHAAYWMGCPPLSETFPGGSLATNVRRSS